jgi:phosphoglycolate phosphatase-like HAD superfamily hydrolase
MTEKTETVAMTPRPTDAECDAASERSRVAQEAVARIRPEYDAALEESAAASHALIRLCALLVPLREKLLSDLCGPGIWGKPPTLAVLSRLSHRPTAEVAACLDTLAAEGLVHRVGNGYEAAPTTGDTGNEDGS